MHKQVRHYCEQIRKIFPASFTGKTVLDCGSLDINGNNRYLFTNCSYTGIDISAGPNVDIVTAVSDFYPGHLFDVVISTEMLEHDFLCRLSLNRMFHLLSPNGLLLITAAGTNRPEHGTFSHHPADSPKTHSYYGNLTVPMLCQGLNFENFSWFEISYQKSDIRFAGIKR